MTWTEKNEEKTSQEKNRKSAKTSKNIFWGKKRTHTAPYHIQWYFREPLIIRGIACCSPRCYSFLGLGAGIPRLILFQWLTVLFIYFTPVLFFTVKLACPDWQANIWLSCSETLKGSSTIPVSCWGTHYIYKGSSCATVTFAAVALSPGLRGERGFWTFHFSILAGLSF